MSETYSEIIIYCNDAECINSIKSLFDHPDKQKKPDFGGYRIESVSIFDHAIIASIIGGAFLDTSSFMDALTASDPDWLYICNDYTQVGEKETHCLKKGGKKTTRKTLLNSIREQSSEVDLYFAVVNKEIDRLFQLLKDHAVDVDMEIDCPLLLFHLMTANDLRLFKLAAEKATDIQAKLSSTRFVEVTTPKSLLQLDAVKGMNLLSVAIEIEAGSIVNYLVKSGIEVNFSDDRGFAPIQLAACDRSKHKFVEPLVKAGADINFASHAVHPALLILLVDEQYGTKYALSTAEKWIKLGADINYTAADGTNALWVSMRREQAIIDFVKSYGVTEYRVPDHYYDGKTPYERLKGAMEINGLPSFTRYCNIEGLDKPQQVKLLHQAAADGCEEAVRIMLQAGFPVHLMDEGRFTAFNYAKEHGHKQLAAFLDEQLIEFRNEEKIRIDGVRPLYERFIDALEAFDAQAGEKDLSILGAFRHRSTLQNLDDKQITFQARSAVRNKDMQLVAVADDELNVTFYHPTRFSSCCEITVSSGDHPEITRFKVEAGGWHYRLSSQREGKVGVRLI